MRYEPKLAPLNPLKWFHCRTINFLSQFQFNTHIVVEIEKKGMKNFENFFLKKLFSALHNFQVPWLGEHCSDWAATCFIQFLVHFYVKKYRIVCFVNCKHGLLMLEARVLWGVFKVSSQALALSFPYVLLARSSGAWTPGRHLSLIHISEPTRPY